MKATLEWFKIYKIPDGKPENKFAFNGEAKNRDFALKVIDEVHKFWRALVKKEVDAGGISWYVDNFGAVFPLQFPCVYLILSHPLCSANVSVGDSPFAIQRTDAVDVVEKSPKPGDALPIEPIGMW